MWFLDDENNETGGRFKKFGERDGGLVGWSYGSHGKGSKAREGGGEVRLEGSGGFQEETDIVELLEDRKRE